MAVKLFITASIIFTFVVYHCVFYEHEHTIFRNTYHTKFELEKRTRTFIDHLKCGYGDNNISECTYTTVPQCFDDRISLVGCKGKYIRKVYSITMCNSQIPAEDTSRSVLYY